MFNEANVKIFICNGFQTAIKFFGLLGVLKIVMKIKREPLKDSLFK